MAVGLSYETSLLLGIAMQVSLWYIAFTNVVAVLTQDQESTIIGANLLQFPLLFVSTAFLPLDVLPGWIQTVARHDPVTYGVDAARALMLGENVMTVLEVSRFGGTRDTLPRRCRPPRARPAGGWGDGLPAQPRVEFRRAVTCRVPGAVARPTRHGGVDASYGLL